MIDREKVCKELESLRDICNAKSNMAIGKGKVAWAGYANTADDALALLKEQEQIPDTTTWVQHLYRLGSKRFECSHCHGTSWRPSDYCPDCGTRMERTVDMDD